MIAGFFGIMSSGKGVLSTKFLKWRLSEYPKKVISNCYLNLPKYDVLTMDTDTLYMNIKNHDMFRNSYLYITELHNIIDARRASSLLNTNFTQFLTQIGKLGCYVIYDSQLLESQIDLRMRAFTPLKFFCERYKIVDGKPVLAVFDDRIIKEQIAIQIHLQILENPIKKLGYYLPEQEDYDIFNTEEIVTLDREKHLSRR